MLRSFFTDVARRTGERRSDKIALGLMLLRRMEVEVKPKAGTLVDLVYHDH